ncbi:uncharacterized protein LOC133339655 [Lethenteron reissneri]|uniref:uncharacterized protein LOC133339655 n=1 Tax=Lethenteron reissneri TaxID=7753 RepID=UPI002AB5F455|nr:uncharacterized protein LOC133339655 [Lethenteron reissneri]
MGSLDANRDVIVPPLERRVTGRETETRDKERDRNTGQVGGDGGTMKWLLVAAFISLLPVTSAVNLQLSLPESVDVTEGESVTLPCSFSPPPTKSNALLIKWVMMPTHYSEKMPKWDIIEIYDSHSGNSRPGVAEFVGDEKGDCSFRILNVSRTLGPVFKCHVYCYRCGTDDWKVFGEVKLNVTAAAPRSRGETSPTPRVHSWWETVKPVAAVVTVATEATVVTVVTVVIMVVGVILTPVAVILFIKFHPWSSWSFPRSYSGDGKADMNGGVEENGHPLMMVNGHKGDNGDKGTDAV